MFIKTHHPRYNENRLDFSLIFTYDVSSLRATDRGRPRQTTRWLALGGIIKASQSSNTRAATACLIWRLGVFFNFSLCLTLFSCGLKNYYKPALMKETKANQRSSSVSTVRKKGNIVICTFFSL